MVDKVASSFLPPRDEAALGLFFGEGMSRIERSPQGAVLERAELYAYDSHECPRCAGSGFVESAACSLCAFPGKPGHCGRPGTVSYMRSPPTGGYPALTARPDKSKQPQETSPPDEGMLSIMSSVSRKLRRLTSMSQTVLLAYYGDRGSVWASAQPCMVCLGTGHRAKDAGHQCPVCKGAGHIERSKVGRLFAVYLLTRDAVTLLKAAASDLPADQALHSLRLRFESGGTSGPVGLERARWARMDLEARGLLLTACKEWRALYVAA